MATREQLILRYAPLVRHAVGGLTTMSCPAMDAEDIYSYGTMGLIDAIDRFDASRGVKFEAYALTRIRGFLIDQIRELDWLPRTARARARTVKRATLEMEERLGRRPNTAELAEATGLAPAECVQAQADGGRQMLSLDTLAATDDEGGPLSLLQRLEDEQSPNPAHCADEAELRRGLAEALERMPEREREILRLRYGQDWTLKQVAARLGVSESRASQLHSQAIVRVRRILAGMFEDLQPLSA